MQQPTILIADDDESIRDLLITLLAESGYNVLVAEDGHAAVAMAQEHKPDIALLDVMMPGLNGFDACRAIKSDPRTADIPVLLLTAMAQTPSKVKGLNYGATDYITKPFDTAELLARLRAALTEKGRRDALAAEALTDPLTGLTNRRGLEQQLDQLLAHAERSGETLSLLLFDADRFKTVNDTYGHDAGDAVLTTLALRARETVRTQDVLGRFGGEEFLAILPGAGRHAAMTAAERLRTHIGGTPVATPRALIPVTVSVGVATAQGGQPIDRGALLAAADRALYSAKQGGRNQVIHADGQPTAPLSPPEPPEAARALIGTLSLVHAPTAAHAQDVAQFCWQISAMLRLAPAERARIALAGLLHDIGKLALPHDLLDDADAVAEHQNAPLHRHVQLAEELLASLPSLQAAIPLVAAHHEWWDGSGYPQGLRGDQIPLGSRVIAVADLYDALQHRNEAGQVTDGLRSMAGTRLDPTIVTAALRILPR